MHKEGINAFCCFLFFPVCICFQIFLEVRFSHTRAVTFIILNYDLNHDYVVCISCPLEAGKTELDQHAGTLAAALSVECTGQAQAAKTTLDQHAGCCFI